MYLSILIFSAFSLHVHANNLNCLSWDPDLVPAGLYCHFKSDAPSPPEVAADKAVKSFVKDVYGAFKLASMQMPVELSAYFANGGDLLETASSNGLQLRSPSDDLFAVDVQYADVKLDLIDGTQATIMDLSSWSDFSHCMSSELSSKTNSATTSSESESANQAYKKCFTDKWIQYAQPLVANITDPNPLIRTPLSSYATCLTTLRSERTNTANDQEDDYDLVLPGYRTLFQILGKDPNGEPVHLTEKNWQLLKQKLASKAYVKERCERCKAPSPATSSTSRRSRLARREEVGVKRLCCSIS